ncbi:VENN motif pre-toxin domain-containing protein [Rosenbergiella epipactidis]|uniref:VENN motif pre-toxin domain-containing protein n=1 Tax=Rosenbergiella epipactidis TaxID=1544694 RepID=UPI0030C89139
MSVLAILGNGLAVAGNTEKSDSSTTHAAVSDGTIIINDSAKQQQNVDDLSRDVAHANQTLSPIFDKEEEQQRMQTLQLIGEIGNQAADIALTQGDIAGFTAAKAKHPTYTDDQLRETGEFKQASQPFGTGGDIQQAITASTAAIQGLAGGDIAKALAGGAAPYLAEEIHKRTTTGDKVNIPANLMAHAVVNAALSLAKGENALAGASSAVTTEAVGMISEAYYDKNPTELKEDEKQTVSALASLAAGLAGRLVGGDTASAVSGMQTGKVTVENNALSDNKPGHDDDELKREHGDRELKVISVKPWTGSLLDENGNPIPGTYKAGNVMPVAGKGTSETTKPSMGADNTATYPKLKNDLVQQNLNNIAKQDPRLDAAVKGSGTTNPNFSVGMRTTAEADRLGKIWVGDGARLLTDSKGWVSADGTRVYRFPTSKPNTPQDLNPTGVQANFETLKDAKRVSNGHMGITK